VQVVQQGIPAGKKTEPVTIEPLPGNFPARMQSSGKIPAKKIRH
jgi:hypothetical protein